MKILVIGISVRALVESAVRSHYPVVALDAFGDRDLQELTECYALRRNFGVPYSPPALFEAGRNLKFEAIAYTSNLENYPEVLELFESNRAIIGNSPETVRSVRKWPDLFARLDKAGFAVPLTTLAGTGELPESIDRWLLKPVSSGGGHGISFHRRGVHDAERQGALGANQSKMLQQYIPGKSCSASFVANGSDSVLIGVSEQLIGVREFGSGGFRYCGSIIPLPDIVDPARRGILLQQVRCIMQFLVREYGLTGVNGFDFIFDGRKIWLTEVNPRYSSSMELMERAYGLPIFLLHTEAVLKRSLPDFVLESRLSDRMFFGKSILFCEKDFIAPQALDCEAPELRDIPMPGEKITKGSPVCTVLTSRPTYADTFSELTRKAGKLKEQIYG